MANESVNLTQRRMLNTVKLGYNEQVTFVRYKPGFVITGVRYNQVNLCYKKSNLNKKSVRYNRVFVNNRVRHNRVSLY